MSDRKRPLEGDNESPSAKKLKSEPTPTNGTKPPATVSADAIAQKRAEIAAKMAAMTAKRSAAATVSVESVPAASPSPAAVKTSTADDLARRVAEAKRRVSEAQSKIAIKDNPYMSMPQASKKSKPPEPAPQGAGLKMAAHPLLLDTTPAVPQSKKDKYKPMQPKFASIKANARNAPTPPPAPPPVPISIDTKANPYAAAAAAASKDTGFEGAPKERTGRNFRFNQKGKYISLGNQMRQDAKLEDLKQRIAETAKKAGLDTEFETLEKHIRRPAPPAAEWWDEALLPNKTYNDLSLGVHRLNIRTPDSPINIYIQHPIPIPAPGEKSKVELKPLMLTKKEQKKVRKNRRKAELEDKRDRIKAGLVPPDPPKVRLSNLMKVLTSDAVQDPTRVEARVRREVAMRKHTHEKMNAERKLTPEQRRAKLEAKKLDEEKRGLVAAVFKIRTLSDPAHRFKVRKNAEQMNLTGLCIFNPSFSMIYVEGASKFVRNYKRLMLNRIAWTERARARGEEDVELQSNGSDNEEAGDSKGKARPLAQPAGDEEAVSLEDNRCDIVWEGQIRDRVFNAFKPRSCPTDGAARDVLGPKLASYWDQAKNWKPEDEDLALAY